eukprot:scaffold159201_cov31-Tisochrysis_lutea.AAC.1
MPLVSHPWRGLHFLPVFESTQIITNLIVGCDGAHQRDSLLLRTPKGGATLVPTGWRQEGETQGAYEDPCG